MHLEEFLNEKKGNLTHEQYNEFEYSIGFFVGNIENFQKNKCKANALKLPIITTNHIESSKNGKI